MIETINGKLIQLYVWATGERGQTSAEYTAVTAVGVGIALIVLWGQLRTAITSAVGAIATQLTTAIPFS